MKKLFNNLKPIIMKRQDLITLAKAVFWSMTLCFIIYMVVLSIIESL